MASVVAILIVVLIWRFVLLIAAEVYQGAGMGQKPATFEARSALTGTGYTTTQSDAVVHDAPSRDAASMLFLVGYIGPPAILGLLGVSFVVPSAKDPALRATVLVGFLLLFFVLNLFGILSRIGRRPARFVARRLFRAHISSPWVVFGDQAVAGLVIAPSSPLVGRRLDQEPFGDPDITLLGVQRLVDGDLQTIPAAAVGGSAQAEDTLVCYGPATRLAELRHVAAGRPPDGTDG